MNEQGNLSFTQKIHDHNLPEEKNMLPESSIVDCKEARYILFNSIDAISSELKGSGYWDAYLLTISRFLIEGIDAPIILDIGANFGAYSIPLAKSIQIKGGIVYGYEPQRTIYYQLCGNIVLNRLDNYEAFNIAVGEETASIDIPSIDYQDNHNVGAFSLIREYRIAHGIEKFSNYRKMISTPMIKLDSLELPKAPSLIKIDVEGYELNVLKGAKKFLEQHCYPPLLFEAWSFAWFAEEKTELLNYCSRLGYEVTWIIGNDFVAQHPANPVSVDFQRQADGRIKLLRVR